MKKRYVFTLAGLEQAVPAVAEARLEGLGEEAIALVARRDIQLQQIPDDLKDSTPMDFVPAALRGAAGGGSIGLLAGLVASAVPSAGVTLAGAALIGVAGAAVGSWSSALIGAAVPNEVQRVFEERIARGEILLVLDAEEDLLAKLEPRLQRAGAQKVDYEAASSLS